MPPRGLRAGDPAGQRGHVLPRGHGRAARGPDARGHPREGQKPKEESRLSGAARGGGGGGRAGRLEIPVLARENTKLVTFDWQSALDFNGQAAPYIQYAHVRCNSILRKGEVTSGQVGRRGRTWTIQTINYRSTPAEIELIDQISRFPGEVQHAAAEYKPLMIASLAYDIAKAFAGFYDACPVVQAESQVRDARLRLVAATKFTLANALGLLGITACGSDVGIR